MGLWQVGTCSSATLQDPQTLEQTLFRVPCPAKQFRRIDHFALQSGKIELQRDRDRLTRFNLQRSGSYREIGAARLPRLDEAKGKHTDGRP